MERFIRDTRGNMAVMFAVSLMVLMAGLGAAVDYSRMVSRKTTLQDYADMAVLAAARSELEKKSDLQAMAQDIVDITNKSGTEAKVKLTILADGTYRVVVTSKYSMMIMGMFSKNIKLISSIAEAPPISISGQKYNIALVMDVTNSMGNTRIINSKIAANMLVEEISKGVDGETMFSIVPFATYVKLPKSYATASWINVQPPSCSMEIDYDLSTGCTIDPLSEAGGMTCTNVVLKQICDVWNGCVGSRMSPWDKRPQYGLNAIQGFTIEDWCHSEMLPLTKNIADVKTAIDDMTAAQETYIPSGLIWGWRSLTPEAPLMQAKTKDKKQRQSALVLMTDGANTRSAGGGHQVHMKVFIIGNGIRIYPIN